jgi:N-acetyl-anhydromuramyl-L-alanine amidase AmpD
MQVSSSDLYTMRWHLNQDPPQTDPALEILNGILGAPPHRGEVDVGAEADDLGVRGARLLRCPLATTTGLPEARTRGRYRKGYPEGAIVHFTAGHHAQKPEDAIKQMVKAGHCYFLIARDGTIYQNFPLSHWGYHSGGKSAWKGLPGLPESPSVPGSVSNELVGIEVMASGLLDSNRRPWYGGHKFPVEETRTTAGDDQQLRGTYHIYTPEQEESLERLVRWLENNNPNVFKFDLVLGHDEVSGPRGIGYHRKNDPGAALSMTMDAFRAKLKA